MPLPAVVESLDGIPEEAHDEYEEVVDGDKKTYKRTYEHAPGLKSALDKERKNVKDLRAANAKIKHIDPEKYAQMEARIQEIEDAAIEAAEGDPDKGKKRNSAQQVREAVEKKEAEAKKEKDELLAKIAAKDAEHITYKAEVKLRRQFAPLELLDDEKAQDTAVEKALARPGKEGVQLDEDGELIVVDKDGDPHTKTVERWLVEDFQNSYPFLFKAKGTTGSGAPANTKKAPGGTGKEAEIRKLPPAQRMAAAFEAGLTGKK